MKFEEMEKLEYGWNSYTAEPPSLLAIDLGRKYVELAAALPPDRVQPSAMGGVGISTYSKLRKAYLEICNNGVSYLLLCEKDSETMDISQVTLETALQKTINYLKG